MAQHDYNIANQSGADFRADLNNALSAIATVNSGASEPSTTFAHQLWVDTSNNVLKIRNAANSAFITTGVSITASNTFAGNLTGNVTGDLTGNADTATTLATARTINGVSFNGSANISFNTDSVAEGSSNLYFTNERVDDQVNALLQAGTGIQLTYDDTAGTLTIANTNDADITGVVAGNALTGGGTSGSVTLNVAVDDSSIEIDSDALRVKASGITNTMLAGSIANSKLANSSVTINSQSLALGGSLDLDTSEITENTNLYYTNERVDDRVSTLIQNGTGISWSYDDTAGTFTPTISLSPFNTSQLSESGNLYYTDARARAAISENSAQLSYNSTTGVLTYTQGDTDTVSEGSNNLYYTSARANTDFDTRLATKSTSNLAEGTNLYYTTARFDSAFTSKDTDDLSEGTTNLYYTQSRFDSAFGNKTTANLTENTNLYYTDTRANSAIDARVVKSFVDALGIQATSVADNSVVLGNDTTGNYIQTVTGTANKITVSGSGSESADITLSLPDDVQIASDLTVAGNLTVNGTLTSLDTTNLDIEDNLFQLNAGLTGSPVNDSGMLINRGTADNGIFMWDESVDKFTLGLTTADGSATGNITLSSLGTLVANLEGSVTGNITGQVSDISNFTTANLTENTNLYYTQARFDSALAAKSTTNLSEGSNLYYTDARFDTRLASKDTDDVSEGTSNLYYTSARFNSAFSGKSTSDLSEGSNLYYTDARVEAVSINNVVEDTTPQLGGNLDLNSSDITGTGDINITGTITSSGNITGTLATAAQPNITSVGTLTGLTGGTGDLNWDSGTLFVDSSANAVGIGETSPLGKLHVKTGDSGAGINVNADELVVEGSGTAGITILSGTSGDGNIFFDDSGGAARGKLSYSHNGDYLSLLSTGASIFYNGGSEAMRIDSSGNLMVGTTTAYGTTGTTINAAGLFYSSADGDRAGQFDRTTSDGELVRFSKAGTTVGSIGSTSGVVSHIVLDPRSSLKGAGIVGGSIDANTGIINPVDKTGAVADGAINLGGSSSRFKDLYLSGTATMGGLTVDTSTLVVDATNNRVGIGTSSPTGKLEIAATGTNAAPHIKLTESGDTREFNIFNDGSGNGRLVLADTDDTPDTEIVLADNGNIQFKTANTERMLVNSSGSVSIGNTVASSMDAGANNLVVGTGSGTEGMTIYSGTANSGVIYFADGASGDDRFRGQIGYSHSDNAFSFRTNASASANMVLDSSGNVGIATSSPDAQGGNQSTILNIEGSDNITYLSGGSGGNAIDDGFAIEGVATGVSSGDKRTGSIMMFRENTSTSSLNSQMAFYTTGSGTHTERMRISSSGSVGIGTNPSTPLHVYSNTSGVIATISGPNNYNSETGISLAIDRAKISGVLNGSGGSPGASLRFYTQPDSGSLTERMRIKSDGQITTQGDILPGADVIMNNGRGISFAATGNSSGSMSSELLDDYEEGAFTATLENTGTSPAPTAYGSYTKIGRQVTIHIYFNGSSSITSAGNCRISGLPFSASVINNSYGMVFYTHGTVVGGNKGSGYIAGTNIDIIATGSTGYTQWNTGTKYGMWTGIYQTA